MSATSLSLLDRLADLRDDEAWRQMNALYAPLIRSWLRRLQVPAQEAEDVAQEVLKAVVGGLTGFRHNRRTGAFRAWLRGITVNRVREARRRGNGPAAATDGLLERLEDPRGDLAKVWDEEHDRHVASHLLGLVQAECRPATWRAFSRLVLDGAIAEVVAAELHTSVNAVLIAKSRVLHRLRARAAGLIDGPAAHFH